MSEELEDMLSQGRSRRVKENFRASEDAVRAWEANHPTTIDSILDWIEELRAVFGDPPPNREPWRGDDFRL